MLSKAKDNTQKLFENLIPIQDYADQTEVCYMTAYRWCRAGMPHLKIGKKIWIQIKESMDWHQRRQ